MTNENQVLTFAVGTKPIVGAKIGCVDVVQSPTSTLTVNVNQLVLFKDKEYDGRPYYRVLVEGNWFYISEATYNMLMSKLIVKGGSDD